jgi:hypothetical protein
MPADLLRHSEISSHALLSATSDFLAVHSGKIAFSASFPVQFNSTTGRRLAVCGSTVRGRTDTTSVRGLGYRNAWVTHEPRCSCNGPSLTFAIMAAPNRSTKSVNTTKSRQFHDMLPSLFCGARWRRSRIALRLCDKSQITVKSVTVSDQTSNSPCRVWFNLGPRREQPRCPLYPGYCCKSRKLQRSEFLART